MSFGPTSTRANDNVPGHIELWTVYDHPKDHPTCFIARRAVVYSGGTTIMTHDIVTAYTLKEIRDNLSARGLIKIPRHEMDDPVIVECWL